MSSRFYLSHANVYINTYFFLFLFTDKGTFRRTGRGFTAMGQRPLKKSLLLSSLSYSTFIIHARLINY